MPNQPKTPKKTFRIPEDLYQAVQERAAEKGQSVSEIVRECLIHYLDGCSCHETQTDGDGQS